jgi:hypothetical protein
MTSFLIAFVSLAFLLGSFAYIALPAASRLRRAVVCSSLALVLGVLFFGYSDMLGRPKSTRLEVLRGGAEEARVVGSYLKEGQGIYLWLQLPGTDEPRYYQLPWDKNVAKAMQEAIQRNADGHGGGVAMHLPFERSWSKEEPKFYPLPQPTLPDKPYEQQQPPTMLYQAPEQGV